MTISANEIAQWKSKLHSAIETHKEKFIVPADKHLKLYDKSRDTFQDINNDEENILINLLFPAERITNSTIYYRTPYLDVKGIEPFYAVGETIQKILNIHFQNKLPVKSINKASLRDSFCTALGGSIIVNDHLGNPNIIYCSPYDLIIDPQVSEFHEWENQAQFVIRKTIQPLSYLKRVKGIGKDKKYTISQDLKSVKTLKKNRRKKDENFQFVDVYEMFIKKEDGTYLITFIEGVREEMDSGKKVYVGNLKPARAVKISDKPYFPVCLLGFYPVPRTFYPQSAIGLVETLQKSFDYLNNREMETVKKFKAKIAAHEKSLTEEGKSALSSEDIGDIVWTKVLPQGVFDNILNTPPEFGVMKLKQYYREMIRIILGITDAQMSGAGQKITATEASKVAESSDIRTADRIDIVSDYVKEQAEKLLILLRESLTPLQIFQMTANIKDAENWEIYKSVPDEVIANFISISVEYGSSMEVHTRQKEAKALLTLQTLTTMETMLNPMRMSLTQFLDMKRLTIQLVSDIGVRNLDKLKLEGGMEPVKALPPQTETTPDERTEDLLPEEEPSYTRPSFPEETEPEPSEVIME